jgi:uncharacterized membrane protein YkvA (DUF1232 family)
MDTEVIGLRKAFKMRRVICSPNKTSAWVVKLLQITREFKTQLSIYRAANRHPRTPRLARWLLLAVIAYAASPIDLIPDFVPVLRHPDDLIVTPALVVLAVRLSPEKVMFECKNLKFQSATSAPKLESPL